MSWPSASSPLLWLRTTSQMSCELPKSCTGASGASALLAAFEHVATDGDSELVFVSGYSGIGKSSVVNELQKA